MDLPSKVILDILTYLLPGFVTAAIVYSLTPAPRPIPFERIVQALIFTIVIQAGVVAAQVILIGLGSRTFILGSWSENTRLFWSLGLAVAFGIGLAWAANTDKVHAGLRKLGVTQQTSFSSEWYGALCQNAGFVVLHLPGQRRLYGWPEEWPSTPGKGHFVMAQAEWVTETSRIELAGVDRILVRAEDVEMVELMTPVELNESEKNDGRAKATGSTAEPSVG